MVAGAAVAVGVGFVIAGTEVNESLPVQVWAAAQHAIADAAGPESPPPPTGREVSAADLTRLRSVLAEDPTLDDDLTEWRGEVVRRPRVAILGPARITAAG